MPSTARTTPAPVRNSVCRSFTSSSGAKRLFLPGPVLTPTWRRWKRRPPPVSTRSPAAAAPPTPDSPISFGEVRIWRTDVDRILATVRQGRIPPLHSGDCGVSIATVDALVRAYGPWWLCNDVTRLFWQSGPYGGPEREGDMVAVPMRAVAPCPAAVLRGTRQRGRGSRATDPSSLS